MNARHAQSGFTLLELVVSLAILAVILGGVASALTLATSALPDDAWRAREATQAQLRVFQQDMRDAVFVRELTSTAIECTVPDRDADGLPEVIRYEWQDSGSKSLVRTVNGASTVLLTEMVDGRMDAQQSTRAESIAIATTTSAAAQLAIVPADWSVSGTAFSLTIRSGIAQVLSPSLPANAGLWRVTNVSVLVKKLGTSGTDSDRIFQIRLANDDGSPSSVVLYQSKISDFTYSGNLTTASTLSVSGMPYIRPDQRICVCFINTSSTVSGQNQFKHTPGSGMWATADAGTSWSSHAGATMYAAITGVSVIPQNTATLVQEDLKGVTLSATDALGQDARVPTVLNRASPLVDHWWRADFDVVPTNEDFDGDGAVDWIVTSGSYTASDLSNGWLLNSKSLGVATTSDLTDPLDLRTRLNIATVGQEWYATLYLDQGGSYSSKLTLRVGRLSDSTYRIRLHENWPFPATLLIDVTIVAEQCELRLVSVPQKDTVTLYVNDTLLGATGYARSNLTLSVSSPILLYGTSTSVKLDWVEARVGGTVQ